MKKTTLLLLSLLSMALTTMAAPALRGPFTVTQTDGTLLTVEQYGDEYHHWTATADGILVVNTGRGCYVAQIDDQGLLTASTLLAHEPVLRGLAERELIARQQRRLHLFHQRAEAQRRRAVKIGAYYDYLPHKGNVRVLCILAQFQDLSFTVNQPLQAFQQMLNGDVQEDLGNANQLNVASVKKYFETSSQGQFSPQFDVVGPITLPNNMDYYGGENDNGSDDKFGKFCTDALAVTQSENLVSDWTPYDNDGDGSVELVCIVYAGCGQNQGGANNTIWAKASYQGRSLDNGMRIAFFNCSCELFHSDPRYAGYINGTGVFIHEMSHCMGLPDLYATQESGKANNQGMESWDIMDYGCYNYNGFAPSLYTAWEQEVMGWINIEPVSDARQFGSLLPLAEGGKAYKIVNPDNENDYIVMENIQQRGLNQRARGHGLLVYHVAYPNDVVNLSDRVNNTTGRPGVACVPASGTLINSYLRGEGKTYTTKQWTESIAASVFPGTKGISSLTDEMQLPNYCFYYGTSDSKPIGFALNGIVEDSETGAVSVSVETGILLPRAEGKDSDVRVFSPDGKLLPAPQRGVNIIDGRTVIVK